MVYSHCADEAIRKAGNGSCDDLLLAILDQQASGNPEGSALIALREARVNLADLKSDLCDLIKQRRRSRDDYPSSSEVAHAARDKARRAGYKETSTIDLLQAILETEHTAAEQALSDHGMTLTEMRRMYRKIKATKFQLHLKDKKDKVKALR